jgi:hypothetical protein
MRAHVAAIHALHQEQLFVRIMGGGGAAIVVAAVAITVAVTVTVTGTVADTAAGGGRPRSLLRGRATRAGRARL